MVTLKQMLAKLVRANKVQLGKRMTKMRKPRVARERPISKGLTRQRASRKVDPRLMLITTMARVPVTPSSVTRAVDVVSR